MTKLRSVSFAVFIAGMFFGLAGTASANNLPSAVSSASCNSNNPSNTVTGTASCSLQGASVSISSFPYPTLQSSVNDAIQVASQDAFADYDYYFQVLGGSAGDMANVDILLSMNSSAVYPNYASADIQVNGQEILACSGDSSCINSSFNGTLLLTVAVDTPIEIHLQSAAEEGYNTGGDISAYLDPYISVDPSTVNAGEYSIQVSPGAGNTLSATPEPTSWLLTISGLGAVGAAVRRRASRFSSR